MNLKFLSLCSGIDAASVAWTPLGWECVGFSEIEPFPCAVLAHHYPTVPNLGDMTKIIEKDELTKRNTRPDVLIGGTPCQSFSLAGKGEGLDDERGQLMLTYVEIAAQYRPKWLVWENVPGCLSNDEGRAFGILLGALTGRKVSVPKSGWGNSGVAEGISSAYGVAWRVLDAQYYGVAQRRRRVFVVGYLGDWRRAAAVLLELDSLCGNPPPSRSQTEDVANTLSRCSFPGGPGGKPEGAAGNHFIIDRASFNQGENAQYEPKISESETMETLVARGPHAVALDNLAPTLDAQFGDKMGLDNQHVNGGCGLFAYDDPGVKQKDPIVSTDTAHCLGTNNVYICGTQNDAMRDAGEEISPTLRAGNNGGAVTPAVAYGIQGNIIERSDKHGGNGKGWSEELCGTQTTGDKHAVCTPEMIIRRLTPIECERLQGFPDNYTLIPTWHHKLKEEHLPEAIQYLHKHGYSYDQACKLANHPDGHRYAALGNSMAVPVIEWVGERIEMIENLTK